MTGAARKSAKRQAGSDTRGEGKEKRAKHNLEGEEAANRADEVEEEAWLTSRHDLDCLKRLQKLNPIYNPHLPFVGVRKFIVAFIFDVSYELSLHPLTTHRAVNYLDRLLSKRTDISRALYQLLATACIFVAGSFPRAAHEFSIVFLVRVLTVTIKHDVQPNLRNSRVMFPL